MSMDRKARRHGSARAARGLGLLASCALLGTGVLSATAGAVPRAPAPRLPAATSSTSSAELTGVTVVPGTTKAIGVGTAYASSSSHDLTELWTGSKWTVMVNPSHLAKYSELGSVWAASKTDAWAVGGSASGAQVLHWNGAKWSVLSLTKLALPSSAYLSSVSGSSASNIWAVGYSFASSTATPVALHFNGHTWSKVAAGGTGDALLSVAVASNKLAWVVGSNFSNRKPVLLGYNGKTWKSETNPAPTGSLQSVSTHGTEAFAVGDVYGAKTTPFALRWTGSKWVTSKVATSSKLTHLSLGPVLSLGASAWAGGMATSGGKLVAVFERYSKGKWALVRPSSTVANPEVLGLGGSATDNVWAVGEHWTGKVCASNFVPVAYHLTKSWSITHPAAGAAALDAVDPRC
jgi:hypothetical protein